jgi:hypothetical protein
MDISQIKECVATDISESGTVTAVRITFLDGSVQNLQGSQITDEIRRYLKVGR